MNKLIGLTAMLCVYASGIAQVVNVRDLRKIKEPLTVGNWLRKDISLGKFIRWKDTTAALRDFGGKLVILDFWFTHCTACIKQFPKEDSLQKKFSNSITFVAVTFDSEKTVKDFLDRWEAHTGIKLSFPVIVDDTLLSKAFHHLYDPHYVWIYPDGRFIGQTSENFVSEDNIRGLLKEWENEKIIAGIQKIKIKPTN